MKSRRRHDPDACFRPSAGGKPVVYAWETKPARSANRIAVITMLSLHVEHVLHLQMPRRFRSGDVLRVRIEHSRPPVGKGDRNGKT